MRKFILCPGCRAALIPTVDWPKAGSSVYIETCNECRHAGVVAVSLIFKGGLQELKEEAKFFRNPERGMA